MTLANGTRLGPYEILSQIGSGGMGEVYRASDPRLGREVAIKVLPERFAEDQDALARFRRETKAVAALSHPNVIAIYDIGEDAGRTFAVMELLEGENLAARLERSPMDWRRAVELTQVLADGLAAAHGKGVVHRDIKPQNIFLTADGGARILDFGLALLAGEAAGEPGATKTQTLETKPGTIMGTVQYMSPEQVRGHAADARSDIFALGCVLHEMISGNRPFARETYADTMAAILNDDPPTLEEAGVQAPAELQRVIAHCLEKAPAQRFQSARDLAFALSGLGGAVREPVAAKETGAAEPSGDETSVAVLPFVNMSSDKENEYFSDGLAEELINALSKIDDLHVASRTSAFSFKGKSQDIREIGEKLNVGTVLEGSVRKAGNRLRISAQLVKVADGYHLWSDSFDRQMEDVFAVQDEIAQNIAKALQVVLTEQEKRAISKAPTTNVQAYDYYLRGRQFFHQFKGKGFERGRRLFIRAYELDPDYAGAYAGVADCCSMLYTYIDANEAYLKEADEASRKALELDPELAEARLARGNALSLSRKYDEARKQFETAIRQNPDLFEAYYFYARACFAEGNLEKAAELFEQACKVRPEDYTAPSLLSSVYAGLGRQAEKDAADKRSLEAAKRHLEVEPDDGRALYYGGAALVALGERERGLEWTERALAADPEEPFVLYNVACTYAQIGEADKALSCLDEAITFGWGQKEWLEHDSDLDPVREHPRFQTILERL